MQTTWQNKSNGLLGLNKPPDNNNGQLLPPPHQDGPPYGPDGVHRGKRHGGPQHPQQQQQGDGFTQFGSYLPFYSGPSCRCLFASVVCGLVLLLMVAIWTWVATATLNNQSADWTREERGGGRSSSRGDPKDENYRDSNDDSGSGRRGDKRNGPDGDERRPTRGAPVPIYGPRNDGGPRTGKDSSEDTWRAGERAMEATRKDFPSDGNVRPHEAHEIDMVEHHAVFNLPRKMDITKMHPEGEGLEGTRDGVGVDGLRLVCTEVTGIREEEYPGSKVLEVRRHRDKLDKGLYIEVRFSDPALESAKCTLYYTVQKRDTRRLPPPPT